MPSNDLIALMQEFGVQVELLGTEETPSPEGLRMADMLLEIHRLRQLTSKPTDRPDAADLREGLIAAIDQTEEFGWEIQNDGWIDMAFIADTALRYLTEAGAMLPVLPEWVDGVTVTLWGARQDDETDEMIYRTSEGTGLTPAAAIADALKDDAP